MNAYTAITLLIVITFFFVKLNSSKVVYLKRLLFPAICCLFIAGLIIFSDTAVKSALKGINLWLYVVFPSLFPFFVGSELLNRSGFVKAMGVLLEPVMRPLFNVPGCGSFTFAMGITSGYPVGAKITSEMREAKLLSKTEAERLLAFTNNSGPLFIIGAVAVGMYNKPQIGLFLLSCHILACITVGIAFRFYSRKEKGPANKKSMSSLQRFRKELNTAAPLSVSSLGNIFGDAIKNSVSTLLSIGGFIIFFSVIINLLIETGTIGILSNLLHEILGPAGINKDIINAGLCGVFEITTGANLASKAANAPFIQQLTITSVIIGWAGLSVHSQVISIVGRTDISTKPYIFGKLLQGIIAGCYTYMGIKISGHFLLGIEPVFSSPEVPVNLSWGYYFINSCKYFLMLMGVIGAFMLFSFTAGRILSKKRGLRH